jgi:hypothetical protein
MNQGKQKGKVADKERQGKGMAVFTPTFWCFLVLCLLVLVAKVLLFCPGQALPPPLSCLIIFFCQKMVNKIREHTLNHACACCPYMDKYFSSS